MTAMVWNWLERLILPAEALPKPDVKSEQATNAALSNVERADREFQNLKRRARALGIEVDVERARRPRGNG